MLGVANVHVYSAGERNVTGVFQFLKKWLNAIGLVLGMAGVAVVWRFGWPQPSFEDGVSIFVEDGTRLPKPNRRTSCGYESCTKSTLRDQFSDRTVTDSGGICLPAGSRISGRLIAVRGEVAPMSV